jgi:hypothetical protein
MRDTGIADRLRAKFAEYGAAVEVVEVAGWQTRGSASFNPRGSVDHHTAGPRNGEAPCLGVVTNGRADLPGPLCHVLVGRGSNRVFVIASGRANHAGSGAWANLAGNSSVFGVERENVGTGAEPWTLWDFHVAALVHAALIGPGGNAENVCEHKEWAPRRKVDAFGVDGNQMRELVRERQGSPASGVTQAPTTNAAPAVAPNALAEIDAALWADARNRPVVRIGSRNTAVRDAQKLLNTANGRQTVAPDGVFGARSKDAFAAFQRSRGLGADGIVGPATWRALLGAAFARIGK